MSYKKFTLEKMVAARLLNQRRGHAFPMVFGCVTITDESKTSEVSETSEV